MADRGAGPPRGRKPAGPPARSGSAPSRPGRDAQGRPGSGARSDRPTRSSGGFSGADRARGSGSPGRSGRSDRVRRGPVAGSEAEADIPDADVSVLPKMVREDLASLGGGLPDKVGRLLAAALLANDENPDSALAFARRARGMAPRSAVVREAFGVLAYRTGDYATARKELQAARRMSGNVEMLPLLADCERALGSPERALDIGLSPDARKLSGSDAVELLIVVAGARMDLGDTEAAVAMLSRPAAAATAEQPWAARIVYAYAAALEAADHRDAARDWFDRCVQIDEDETTDASERLLRLTAE